jgi:hypothetical protein
VTIWWAERVARRVGFIVAVSKSHIACAMRGRCGGQGARGGDLGYLPEHGLRRASIGSRGRWWVGEDVVRRGGRASRTSVFVWRAPAGPASTEPSCRWGLAPGSADEEAARGQAVRDSNLRPAA